MYIVHHALKNIERNKGRNLLMGVIVLAIIVATVVSLIINNASSRIIDDYKAQFGSKVSLAPDLQQMYSEGENFNRVTPEQYMAFAESDYLAQSTFTAEVPGVGETVKAVGEENNPQGGQLRIGGPGGEAQGTPTMKILGHSSEASLTEFADGQRQLAEGRMYEATNEAIVSKEFADENGISVGDTIAVNSLIGDDTPYELTVTGIYLDATPEFGDMPIQMSFMNRRNEILTSFDTIMSKSGSAVNIQATYYLKDPDLLAEFESELRGKGLPEAYAVNTDEASYDKVVGPVESMKGIFFAFFIVVLLLGAIILTLLSSMAIRERKYEIGVLRAMGMKKGKVAAGLLAEALVIMAVCLAIGLGAGTALSQPVADVILSNQVEAAEKETATSGPGKFLMVGGQSNMSNVSAPPISELDVGLDGATLAQIAGIALLLAAVSSIAGIRNITKYEPIKILMERH